MGSFFDSSQTGTSTTSTTLTPEQQALINAAMPQLTNYANNLPTISTNPADLVAGFNPNQVAGQNAVLGATGAQSGIVGNAGNASNFLTSGEALTPSTNPYEAAQMTAATQPIYENLNDVTLPQLRNNATSVGQTGSSREGIAEGLATRGANEAAGQVTANIGNQSYNAGLQAMLQAIGLAPSTASAQTIPGATQSAVGDTQQAQSQSELDAVNAAKLYNAQQPLSAGEALASVAAGLPGASTTTTGTYTGSPSTFQDILGGVSTIGGLLGKNGISSLTGGIKTS